MLENDEILRLGQFAEVNLFLPEIDNAFALPFEALYGFNRAYIILDGRLKKVNVTRLGDTISPDGTKWALLKSNELKKGDIVAVTQLPNAINGLKVNLVKNGEK